MSEDPEAAGGRQTEHLTDPKAMRALAHPLRLTLLDALRREGELTATAAAELLGDSPGNMSWHLQTLARYGFVEETGTGKGRSRPWRAVVRRFSFTSSELEPEAQAAGDALELAMIERAYNQLQDWRARRHGYSTDWVNASFMSNSVSYVTAVELNEISARITAIFTAYEGREDPAKRPAGAIPVRLTAHGHPLV